MPFQITAVAFILKRVSLSPRLPLPLSPPCLSLYLSAPSLPLLSLSLNRLAVHST